jgi:hypothetical protein
MKIPQWVPLCGLALACSATTAQPDYALHATPIGSAPADPAIVRALATIKPQQIQETIQTLVGFGTRSTLSSMEADLPPGQGINAAADWIAAQFESISHECGGCLEVKRDIFTADPASGAQWARRIPRPTKITNVYAILRGTDPEQAKRMVLVTGHYDSRNSSNNDDHAAAPGANDDASGVAVSLECARALSKLKFPGTIVFVAVAGEEQGLVGSGHLAKLARDEGWDLEAALNNDIVGGNTTPGDTLQLKDRVRVFSEGVPQSATPEEARAIRALGKENDSPSRELARAIAETAHTYLSRPGAAKPFTASLIDRPDRYLRGGDHSSFNHEGFAAVRFTEWREDYNHQHQNVVMPPAGSSDPILGDLLRFVDFNYVAQVARLNAATLATLAFAPGEPQKVAIVNKMTENGSTLTWEPPVGGGVAHYEVLWRETTAPNWQYTKQVAAAIAGDPLTVTLPVSKDNVIFGVRAVDAKGHRGLVVVP